MNTYQQHRIDTTEVNDAYLLRGDNGKYMRLSPDAFYLVQTVRSGASFEEVAAMFTHQRQQIVSPSEVQIAYQTITNKIKEIENNNTDPLSGFFYRRDIFSQHLVTKISQKLILAFTPLTAFLLLAFIVIMLTIFLTTPQLINTGSDYESFWLGLGLFVISMTVHEFGHATACSAFHAQPGAIGFGLYLIYPMFYSDVSSAWSLKRWQRVVVDISGVYFQLLICSIYIGLYFTSGYDSFRVATFMIIGSCLFSLNPVLKFDGYWLVADALGVTNLSKQPKRILRYVMDIMQQKTPEPLPWSFATTASLVAYSLVSFVFWILFIWATIPMLWHKALVYPHQVYTIVQQTFFSTSNLRYSEVMAFLTSSFQLLLLMLMLRGIVMLIANPVLRFLKKNIFPSRASGTML